MLDDRSTEPRAPRIVDLAAIRDEAVGGKARGLQRLLEAGLPVPDGFVILDATPDALPADLEERTLALGGGPVAVRSSALGEDSAAASFAGQYETLLDVEGFDALRSAVVKCLRSAQSERASAYRDARDEDPAGATMCVVVQRMVAARAAGVLFTVDPVTSRRAHAVVDAVPGLGESLVSGTATPDHFVVARDGAVVASELHHSPSALRIDELHHLVREALRAEEALGEALDLEWAIDAEGQVHWLQARPITTLEADLHEFDTPLRDLQSSSDVYTRCNVGEMFPGAATPLSISFTARAIDVGMQMMHQALGIQGERLAGNRFIRAYSGHLFLNLTTMSDAATQALGSSAEQMCLSVCGRPVAEFELKERPAPPLRLRIPRALRYARYLFSRRGARRRIAALDRSLHFPASGAAREQWERIERHFEAIFLAMHYHLVSSASAGILTPTLLAVVARGEEASEEHHAEVAALLAGAEDVESADIAAGAERILARLIEDREGAAHFASAPADAALAWLESGSAGAAGEEFRRYLERHGHRAVRELELRQPEWAHAPLPLVTSLQASTRGALAADAGVRGASTRSAPDPIRERSPAMRWLVRRARSAVRSREETKSRLVGITRHFKRAYRQLGEALVREGVLPDADALFFLTHDELGELTAGRAPQLAELALERREVLERQMALSFPDVFVGDPVPEKLDSLASQSGGVVSGTPVSRGRVTGIARVVHSLEEAAALQEGEILITPVTDVGWTPYFNLIAGLVTDVGSAVSHGAVVAREFRLPAVVNTRIATRSFETGDTVVLDGDEGVVRRLEAERGAQRERENP